MRTTTLIALAAGLLSAPTGAIQLQKRTDGAPRVVSLDLHRNTISDPVQRDRLRRRGTVQANLDNEETLYFVNGTLGTPAQSLRLHVDTGSSDLWVNTPTSTLCSRQSKPCSFAGTYTANSSSTYKYVGSWFNISYVDGSGAAGDYVTDTFTIGGNTVDSLQFGIGYTSSSAQGILGIGYPAIEVQVGRAGKAPYNNLPAKLAADGKISTNAYSLWLNDLDANTGSILFGGVDTEQYTGTLTTLPIQKESGQYAEFLVTLTGLSLGSTSIASNQALAVLLDSGSSLTYLPDDWVSTIYSQVNATYSQSEGAAYVPCSLENDSRTLDFSFSGATISVQMNELVIDLVTSSGKRPTFSNGVEACLFGIAPADMSTNVLGDTFIRSAYLVYDIANNEIGIAPTKFNSTTSNVLEITNSSTGIPDSTSVANAVTATSGIANSGTGTSSSSGNVGETKSAAPAGLAVSIVTLLAGAGAGILLLIL